MKKVKDDYRSVPFIPVLSGALAFLHRPSKGGLHTLQELGCTCVVTLLSPTENPEEIKYICEARGLKWIYVGLQGANKRLLESNKTAWMLRKGLAQAKQALLSGDRILVHCAAGIHRTGTFSYILLRLCGFSSEETMEFIHRIRLVTFEQCGQARFDLGEDLARQILCEGNKGEIPEFAQMNFCEFVEKPIVFVKIMPLDTGMLRFDCVVTDFEIGNYVLGPSVNLKINFQYLKSKLGSEWISQKEIRSLQGGLAKNFKNFDSELLNFFSESFPKSRAFWAGTEIEQDLSFISTFLPLSLDYASPNSLPLNFSPLSSIFEEIIHHKSINP